MSNLLKDKLIIRELAKSVAEIAALPVQEEKRKLWKNLNGLKPDRPPVMIDQICWHELNFDGSLDLLCEDQECRLYEQGLRQLLFKWKHFPGDMVIEPFIDVSKAIINNGYGLEIEDEVLVRDPDNSVTAHKYVNLLENDDDIEKITIPDVSLDVSENTRRIDFAKELFDGIIDVRPVGWSVMTQLWDPISTYMGAENAVYAMVDRPEFMHRLVKKMMTSLTSMIDQLEDKGLLCDINAQTTIHCTGAYTDDLPAPGYDPEKPRCKDVWTAGLAQMFSMVSPDMHQEFELDYMNPIFKRFGFVYYGCCEPLDMKLDIVKKIPNVRKISMSPWTDAHRGAEELGRDFVFSSKPNPAFLAGNGFDEKLIRDELTAIKNACDSNNCPLEFILKDISTIRYDAKRLFKWTEIATDVSMN